VVDLGWWSTGFLTPSGLLALILPSITLGLYQMTLIMRLVRSEMLEVMRQDYIRFARARGLKDRAIHFRHALKNTLVPVITVTGLQLGSIIAFAIITETVFQWPGVGLLFINAIQFVDIPVMAAYLMLISVMFVAINLIVDLLYVAIDPRCAIGQGGGRHERCDRKHRSGGARALAHRPMAGTATWPTAFRRSPVAMISAPCR
jgi:peptide/nickel transport system permease protein